MQDFQLRQLGCLELRIVLGNGCADHNQRKEIYVATNGIDVCGALIAEDPYSLSSQLLNGSVFS